MKETQSEPAWSVIFDVPGPKMLALVDRKINNIKYYKY